MRYLNIFNIELPEITPISCSTKLPPVIRLEFGRIPIIYQLLKRLHPRVMRRIQEIRNRKPFLLRIHHHSVFYALVLVIAPNLRRHE